MEKKIKHKLSELTVSDNPIQDRAEGAILGAWIGDALGLGPQAKVAKIKVFNSVPLLSASNFTWKRPPT